MQKNAEKQKSPVSYVSILLYDDSGNFCFFTLAAQIVQVRVYLRFYRLLTILEHAF